MSGRASALTTGVSCDRYADRCDNAGGDPDERAKPGRSDQSAKDCGRNVEREVRDSQQLLHSERMCGDGAQRRYNRAG